MAMTSDTLQLRAKAKRAGIENYGSMSAAELRTALAGGKGSKKRKSASTLGKRKSASAVKTRTSSTRKSAKKTPAAKSAQSGKAKRSSSGGRKVRVPAPKASSNSKPGRNLIDRSQIDWKLPWPGGESGNRGIIMKALRKHRGNYSKVYDALKDNARKMFPKSSKTGERYSADKSRQQLRWYIGRTAFDFVTGTGQHSKSTNRKADRRTAGKDTGARKTTRKPKAAAKATRKPAKAQKAAQSRARASQRPGGRTRKSTRKRKSVKR